MDGEGGLVAELSAQPTAMEIDGLRQKPWFRWNGLLNSECLNAAVADKALGPSQRRDESLSCQVFSGTRPRSAHFRNYFTVQHSPRTTPHANRLKLHASIYAHLARKLL